LKKIEKKLLPNEIGGAMLQKHAAKMKEGINVLSDDLCKTEITASNLEKPVEKCLDFGTKYNYYMGYGML
jgi:hypothetical protein